MHQFTTSLASIHHHEVSINHQLSVNPQLAINIKQQLTLNQPSMKRHESWISHQLTIKHQSSINEPSVNWPIFQHLWGTAVTLDEAIITRHPEPVEGALASDGGRVTDSPGNSWKITRSETNTAGAVSMVAFFITTTVKGTVGKSPFLWYGPVAGANEGYQLSTRGRSNWQVPAVAWSASTHSTVPRGSWCLPRRWLGPGWLSSWLIEVTCGYSHYQYIH